MPPLPARRDQPPSIGLLVRGRTPGPDHRARLWIPGDKDAGDPPPGIVVPGYGSSPAPIVEPEPVPAVEVTVCRTTKRLRKVSGADLDILILALALRQFGVFHRRQAFALGATAKQIESRLSSGRWTRWGIGIYALDGFPNSWERSLWRVLLMNPLAVVSGASAAAVHRLTGFNRSRLEVTVPRGSNTRLPMARVHSSNLTLTTSLHGFPIVTPAQVFVDLAGNVSDAKLIRALEDALAAKLLDISELGALVVVLDGTRKQGLPVLRALLDTYGEEGYVPPANELERALYGVTDRADTPGFVRQATAPWWSPAENDTVDALAPVPAIVLEADGRRWHTRQADFENDRRRDSRAGEHGHRVIRQSYFDLIRRPDDCARSIQRTAQFRVVPVDPDPS